MQTINTIETSATTKMTFSLGRWINLCEPILRQGRTEQDPEYRLYNTISNAIVAHAGSPLTTAVSIELSETDCDRVEAAL